MYNGMPSPIMVISSEAAKKVFDKPQDLSKKAEAIKKARKDMKKMGFLF